jgi:hypothetical protein
MVLIMAHIYKTIAIHHHDDWFLVNIPGLGNSTNKEVMVEVKLVDGEKEQPNYKLLRDYYILYKYMLKRKKQVKANITKQSLTDFDLKFGTAKVNSIFDILNTIS